MLICTWQIQLSFQGCPILGRYKWKNRWKLIICLDVKALDFKFASKLWILYFFIAISDHLSSDSVFVSYRVDLAHGATHQQCCRGWFIPFSKLFPKFALKSDLTMNSSNDFICQTCCSIFWSSLHQYCTGSTDHTVAVNWVEFLASYIQTIFTFFINWK